MCLKSSSTENIYRTISKARPLKITKVILAYDSVERCLEIVGLPMANIRDTDISVAESFTDYHKIIALRNVLAHTYFKSKVRQIWNAIQENLPILLNEARRYINTNLDDNYKETF